MVSHDIKYIIGLSFFEGIGPVRYRLLKNYFGSARKIFEASEQKLSAVGLPQKLVDNFVIFRKKANLDQVYRQTSEKGIRVIDEDDKLYPQSLKEQTGHPFILYLLGKVELLEEKTKIAIVGTRMPTAYGKELTKQFSSALAESGVTIVSGMAMGVDAIAHQTAIDCNGKTIAVLGSGVDICYPRINWELYNKIKKDGLLLSEFPPGMTTSKGVFPSRNRIVAGLSNALVVTEGAEGSGSLITARFAAEYGRDVYAVPGPVTSHLSYATNFLIKNGAKLATSAADILADLHIEKKKKVNRTIALNNEEEKIVTLISNNNTLHIDEIARNLNVTVSSLSVQLSVLTMKGVLQEMDGGEYTIKT